MPIIIPSKASHRLRTVLSLGLGVLLSACQPPVAPDGAVQVPIVALIERTNHDASVRAGFELAVDDVNQRLAAQGSTVRLSAGVETLEAPSQASDRLKALAERGIKAIVGPIRSETAIPMMQTADERGVLVISPSVTAPSLGLEDMFMRTAPVDVLQARAIAGRMRAEGIKAVVALGRDDLWGRELDEEMRRTTEIFELSYAPTQRYAIGTTDFAPAIEALAARVAEATAQHGAEHVAVAVYSFEEARAIFRAAASRPALAAVRWFGCDGNAMSPELTADAEAAAFAAQTRFSAAIFERPDSSGGEEVASRLRSRLSGQPSVYAYTAYDAVRLIGLAAERLHGAGQPLAFREAVSEAARTLNGASGPIVFTPEGDRISGLFGFYGLQAGAWALERLYDANTDEERTP